MWILLSISFVGLFIVFFSGKSGIDTCQLQFDEVVDDRMPKIEAAESVVSNTLRMGREMRQMMFVSSPEEVKKIDEQFSSYIKENNEYLAYLHKHVNNPKAIEMLNKIEEVKPEFRKNITHALDLAREKKLQEFTELITSDRYKSSVGTYQHYLQDFANVQKSLAKNLVENSKHSSAQNSIIMIVVGVLSSLLLLVVALFIIRAISLAIKEVVENVSRVSTNMNFDSRLPSRKDELNEVSSSFNQLLGMLQQSIAEANKVVGAIANADFTQRMTGSYVGDLDALQRGVNASANSVSFMMGELERVMRSLHSGKFDVRMDEKVPKAFRDLVESALVSIDHVIADINTVMAKMNEGSFSHRVNAEAQGSLLSLKVNINASMDAIAEAINAISNVVSAQAIGDLTKSLPDGAFRGQLDELKSAINNSASKLREIVEEVMAASALVSDASGQVSQGSADLSGRVQEQAAALEETSATMNEMASAVQANTENARRVADLAHDVQNKAQEGVDVMDKTIEAMQSIRESSHKIADIVSLIDGIAFQTNLLALNAAVEAARAGEHGRGFAVVAGEVRALAQKSADAAKDIKGLIDDSVTRVENGTHLAEKSGETLGMINQSVAQVAGMIEQIANASNEQATGINQVHKSIADIDLVTQQNAALVEETTSAAESLGTEAENLRQSMGFFNTGLSHHFSAPTKKSRSAVSVLTASKADTATEWGEF